MHSVWLHAMCRVALAGHWLAWQLARAALVLGRAATSVGRQGGLPDPPAALDRSAGREQRVCEWRATYEAARDSVTARTGRAGEHPMRDG